MPSASRTIYYLEKSKEFAQPVGNYQIVLMDPTVLIFKGVYLGQTEVTPAGLERGTLSLSQQPANTLLRPVPSSDVSPSWSAIVYRKAGSTTINLREEHRVFRTHYQENPEQALCYHADPPGGSFAWETDSSAGKSGYFLTGGFGLNALWRVTRIQADALNRQVLTFSPVQLTPTLALPLFEAVTPTLRAFLTEHFEGFQQAVTHNAYFSVIDRANNLAEGILSHCLKLVGVSPPDTLNGMLREAKKILEGKAKGNGFTLSYYGYNLAHVIRNLHARLHASESASGGNTVRPEVGLNLTVTVSELLVDVGLGKY